jgi:hypothetical protein
MPAAELTRLREQLNHVTVLFDRPADFGRMLTELMELYSDRSYRPGQEITGQPLLPTYRLPPLVSRQIELALSAAVREHPAEALPVIDELWRQARFEPRILATILLGQVPLSQAEGILERLAKWADPAEDRQVLEGLLSRGTVRLRAEGYEALLELYGVWLTDPKSARRSIGLKALLALVKDRQGRPAALVRRSIGIADGPGRTNPSGDDLLPSPGPRLTGQQRYPPPGQAYVPFPG